MSDFNDVVKHLDIVKSRKATKDEAINNPQPFDKYYSLKKTRKIEKLNIHILLPAFLKEAGINLNRLAFQYNVTMPSDFYLLNPIQDLIGKYDHAVVCVRWRVGGTAFRYNISTPMEEQTVLFRASLVPFEIYNNQKIGKNCVFEFWYIGIPPFIGVDPGIIAPVTLKTSLLMNPTIPDDTLIVGAIGDTKNFASLNIGLPVNPLAPITFPLDNTTMSWNSN